MEEEEVNIVLNVHETIRPIRDGEKGGRGYGGGVREIYTYQHQNDSCIKMGSDESHFNVSLIARDRVTRQCPQTTTFEAKVHLHLLSAQR